MPRLNNQSVDIFLLYPFDLLIPTKTLTGKLFDRFDAVKPEALRFSLPLQEASSKFSLPNRMQVLNCQEQRSI